MTDIIKKYIKEKQELKELIKYNENVNKFLKERLNFIDNFLEAQK